MISEGSCDTEDWSNDAENSALITGINFNYVGRHIMAIFPDDNVKIHQDGNKCCKVISIKRCIIFWSRSCTDNARGEHSVKSTPAHPKGFQ